MSFYNPYAFFVLILLVSLLFIKGGKRNFEEYFSPFMLKRIRIGRDQKKLNFTLLLLSFVCLIIALARPIIENKPIVVSQSSAFLIVAFDISKSMMANDVYPNRLLFAKNKFYHLLENLKNEKVGVVAFSRRGFLLSPLTNDYETVKYLVDNMSLESISVSGSLVKEAILGAVNISVVDEEKALLIFTDGCDSDSFVEEIALAKQNNIKVFIYGIGEKKGSPIESNGDFLKDKEGNIVITKLNENIKNLALETNGAYLEYSSQNEDIIKLLDEIRTKLGIKKIADITITDNVELFYIPLTFGILFFMLAISGFGRTKKVSK